MQKTEINRYKDYLRRLLIIAVPIILSNLITELQMMIDRIFLGHVNSLYMSAIGNGTMTLTGEATGKRDLKQYIGVCKMDVFHPDI